jgi:Tfp pilus assembly protein PilF
VYAELLNQPEAGLDFVERARKLAPNAANVADTYGWLLWQRDHSGSALPLLQDAASRLPDSPEAQYHLGLALVRVGQKEAGRAALTRALSLSPSFAGAHEARVALAAK